MSQSQASASFKVVLLGEGIKLGTFFHLKFSFRMCWKELDSFAICG